MAHEQRLVLVDRQPGLALAAGELEPDAAAGDPLRLDQRDDLLVDPQLRILQVDRVHRVIRHRHVDAQPRHFALAGEADNAREAAARTAVGDAVQIDEAHGLFGPVDVADAGAEARRDEGEVRVGVARLDRPLRRRQVLPAIELIVLVAGPLGEHRAKDLEVGRDRRLVVARQPRGQALLEIPGGRVK